MLVYFIKIEKKKNIEFIKISKYIFLVNLLTGTCPICPLKIPSLSIFMCD